MRSFKLRSFVTMLLIGAVVALAGCSSTGSQSQSQAELFHDEVEQLRVEIAATHGETGAYEKAFRQKLGVGIAVADYSYDFARERLIEQGYDTEIERRLGKIIGSVLNDSPELRNELTPESLEAHGFQVQLMLPGLVESIHDQLEYQITDDYEDRFVWLIDQGLATQEQLLSAGMFVRGPEPWGFPPGWTESHQQLPEGRVVNTQLSVGVDGMVFQVSLTAEGLSEAGAQRWVDSIDDRLLKINGSNTSIAVREHETTVRLSYGTDAMYFGDQYTIPQAWRDLLPLGEIRYWGAGVSYMVHADGSTPYVGPTFSFLLPKEERIDDYQRWLEAMGGFDVSRDGTFLSAENQYFWIRGMKESDGTDHLSIQLIDWNLPDLDMLRPW